MMIIPAVILAALYYMMWRAIEAIRPDALPPADVEALVERTRLLEDENASLLQRLNNLEDEQQFAEQLLRRSSAAATSSS